MLYLLFFLLKDGPYLVRQILDSLPLSDFAKQHLFAKFRRVARHGKRHGGGGGGSGHPRRDCVCHCRYRRQRALGRADGLSSRWPAIGSAIVWVPAAIFLFATHQLWQGLFIVGFFVIIVGLVDNILRPLLVGKTPKCRTT
jgi:predicted PurR-regulated permease PerM